MESHSHHVWALVFVLLHPSGAQGSLLRQGAKAFLDRKAFYLQKGPFPVQEPREGGTERGQTSEIWLSDLAKEGRDCLFPSAQYPQLRPWEHHVLAYAGACVLGSMGLVILTG